MPESDEGFDIDVEAELATHGGPVGRYETFVRDLGNGNKLVFDTRMAMEMLHSQPVVDAITKRGRQMAEFAQQLADAGRFGPRFKKDPAQYIFTVQNEPGMSRARVRVRPKNFTAVLDNYYNNTLIKAYLQFPSDPKPV